MSATALAWVFIDVPPQASAAALQFWTRVLGEEPVQDGHDPRYAFFPTPVRVRVGLQRIDERDAARVHMDLSTDDVEAEARRLEALGAARVGNVDDHVVLRDPAGLLFCVVPARWSADVPVPVAARPAFAQRMAAEIDGRIRSLPQQSTTPVRRIRREYSQRLRAASAQHVLAVGDALVGHQRWVAYELVYHHRPARSLLNAEWVTRLGRGLDGWTTVDAFGRYIAGPAWQQAQVPDDLIEGWAASSDRWWRRAALVATVPLNLRAAGGTGDTIRTLDICQRLVTDRDDMVVKALSWALRQLTVWDPQAVRAFLDEHADALASRVRREVTSKLDHGVKRAPVSRRGTTPQP